MSEITAWLDARDESFELGYQIGYAAGYDVGVGSVYHELYQASIAHRFRYGPFDIPLTKLIGRRAEIGDACRAFTERHGGEYRGGPVDWHTGWPERWPA